MKSARHQGSFLKREAHAKFFPRSTKRLRSQERLNANCSSNFTSKAKATVTLHNQGLGEGLVGSGRAGRLTLGRERSHNGEVEAV